MISDTVISAIKERLNIAEVIGESVKLKRAGQSFVGLCPFHSDSKPSFHVNPARQFFYCFGCGAKGDVIRFVMQMEGKPFMEAVTSLADRAGVVIEESRESRTRKDRARSQDERERYHALLGAAVSFYEERLQSAEGEGAREELKKRGLPAEMVKEFRLGYAPEVWDSLARHLERNGFPAREAEKAGLCLERRGGGHYDRFRNRLMFPITDEQGRFIGFSGRTLSKEEQAKYINSPETRFYRKGSIVFGLANAKVDMRRKGEAILVEGNFDLLGMHAAGFRNTVAPLGTALTPDQAHLVRRFADRVVIMFDGDDAGRAAARRAFGPLKQAGMEVLYVRLPAGEDPDSFVRKSGKDGMNDLLAKRRDLVEIIIEDAFSESTGSPSAISRTVASLAPYLDTIQDPLERDLVIKKIARESVLDEPAVRRALKRSSASPSTGPSSPAGTEPRSDLRNRTEREITGVLMDSPGLLDEIPLVEILEYFRTGPYKDVLQRVGHWWTSKEPLDPLALIEGLGNEEAERFVSGRLVEPEFSDVGAARKVLTEAVGTLRKRCYLREEEERLNREIAQAERSEDPQALERLLHEKRGLVRKVLGEGEGEEPAKAPEPSA